MGRGEDAPTGGAMDPEPVGILHTLTSNRAVALVFVAVCLRRPWGGARSRPLGRPVQLPRWRTTCPRSASTAGWTDTAARSLAEPGEEGILRGALVELPPKATQRSNARARSWPQPPSMSWPADVRSLVSTPRRCR